MLEQKINAKGNTCWDVRRTETGPILGTVFSTSLTLPFEAFSYRPSALAHRCATVEEGEEWILNRVVTVDELQALPDAAEQDDLIEGIDVQNDKSKARTEERATLVGKLEGLDVHGSQPVFHVYDPLSGKKVRCLFDKEKLGYAKESLPHRVSVTGTATYNNKGQIVSIKVIHFRKLRSRNELPQASDLEGIDLTGGIDPTEYVRRLRDA